MTESADFLRDHPDIETIDALLPDLSGYIRGKRVLRNDLEKVFASGIQMPASTAVLDITGDSDDPEGIGFSDGDPDATARVIAGTLVPVPWFEKPMAQVLLSLFGSDGKPYENDPRTILTKVLARFEGLGLRPVVALEQEFYLLDPEGAIDGNPQPPILPATGRRATGMQVLSISELEGFALFLDQVAEACKIQKISIGPTSAEFSVGQYEINLKHTDDPLAAADAAALLPRTVKGVARQHGVEATFMAKPYADQSGNGMHMHISLLDNKGNNVFSGGDEIGNEILHHATGGMLATMPDAMAIYAPNINSYRRFAPDTYVPIARTWGVNNRSVAIRIPGGDDANRRVEHRIAGADTNPYLALAATLAGIHHGITNKITPPPISTGNAGTEVDNKLPFKLDRALDTLAASDVMADYLGEKYVRIYTACKRGELARFMSVASPREYAWYLRSEG